MVVFDEFVEPLLDDRFLDLEQPIINALSHKPNLITYGIQFHLITNRTLAAARDKIKKMQIWLESSQEMQNKFKLIHQLPNTIESMDIARMNAYKIDSAILSGLLVLTRNMVSLNLRDINDGEVVLLFHILRNLQSLQALELASMDFDEYATKEFHLDSTSSSKLKSLSLDASTYYGQVTIRQASPIFGKILDACLLLEYLH
jgi:hypothetical protein